MAETKKRMLLIKELSCFFPFLAEKVWNIFSQTTSQRRQLKTTATFAFADWRNSGVSHREVFDQRGKLVTNVEKVHLYHSDKCLGTYGSDVGQYELPRVFWKHRNFLYYMAGYGRYVNDNYYIYTYYNFNYLYI